MGAIFKSIFIVHRDSADGPESDAFDDRELAEEWAEYIGGNVTEEFIIDRAMLNDLKESHGGREEGE